MRVNNIHAHIKLSNISKLQFNDECG